MVNDGIPRQSAVQPTHLTDGNDVSLLAALAAGGQPPTLVTPTLFRTETNPVSGETGLFGVINDKWIVHPIDVYQFRRTSNASVADPFYLSFLSADNTGAIDQVAIGQFRLRLNGKVY